MDPEASSVTIKGSPAASFTSPRSHTKIAPKIDISLDMHSILPESGRFSSSFHDLIHPSSPLTSGAHPPLNQQHSSVTLGDEMLISASSMFSSCSNATYNNDMSGSSGRGKAAGSKVDRAPPRPPNSFILYRREKHSEIVAKNSGGKSMNNNVISKIVADLWRLETSEVKAVYAAKAEAEKRAHMLKYPGYKYQPRKSAKRVAEAAVKKSSAKSSKKAKTHALPPATDHQAMPPMVMEHHHHQHQPAIPAELESFWASNPEYQSPDGAVYDWPHVMDYSSHPPYNHPSHFPHHLQETQPGYYAYPDYHNFSDAYLMPPQEP